jgi:hypothetical protein
MGAGASQSKNEDLYAVGMRTPTAPPLSNNNANKTRRNTEQRVRNAEKRVSNANKKLRNIENSRVTPAPHKWSPLAQSIINKNRNNKEKAKKGLSVQNTLKYFNQLSPEVKNAIITNNPRVLLTEPAKLNSRNVPQGGGMKTRKRRVTKKAHKNKRRHSRRN